MGSDTVAGEDPFLPEDTLDLGERLDPVRTLLRRAAGGDREAAGALVGVLGPRIHGLALHMTGSSARAGTLTVWVLRRCLRDAAQLAGGGLPGEAAVLDRARRAAVATRPTGDVRSLVAPDPVVDRTRDRREVEVMRALLTLSPDQRALVESAAQGRFPYVGPQREEAAALLARVLDQLVPFGGPHSPTLRSLAALDALALADEQERAHLRELTAGPEAAGVHRHAIEAAARLTLLTAVAPSRELHQAVLEGWPPSARTPAPVEQSPPGEEGHPPRAGAPDPDRPAETAGTTGETAGAAGPRAAEAVYRGTYATPVLGTDSQRRVVGPPALAGGVEGPGATAAAATAPRDVPRPATGRPVPAPAFAFDPSEKALRSRRRRRREAREAARSRRRRRGVPWLARSLAALATIAALVLAWVVVDTRSELATARQEGATWARLSVQPGAQPVSGVSDNGSWQAVLTDEEIALRAQGVGEYEGEVLQLWGETDGESHDLGVLEVTGDGGIAHSAPATADRLVVTRESAPRNLSGTPSPRVVASLDPEPTGG